MSLLTFPNKLLGWMRWWLVPRSTERDEAFRERVLRTTLAFIILLGLLSFASTLLLFDSEWALISFPTLHIVGLGVCFGSAALLLRGQLVAAGWLLVLTLIVGISGVVLLGRQSGSSVGVMLAVAIYMIVPVVATLVLPRRFILPISAFTTMMYMLSQFAIPIDGPVMRDFSGFSPEQQVISALLLLLTEGVLLRQLRVEFDARLEAMSQSIRETEIAKMQAEAARQQAEAADRAKSQFLANMSHELRTPLNAIIGYDEAMLAGMVGGFEPKQTELLGHIQKNGRRLLALINDVLDLSKIEAGSLELYIAPMSLPKVIEGTVADLSGLALEKNIQLRTEFGDHLPEVILGDSRKIEQVLVNLVGNAIKFTENGEVRVEVRNHDYTHWQLLVHDTGIGLSPEAVTYIFEPFRQVDGGTTRKYKGTGLGLSITKRLVEKMGGTIMVESEPGVGSTFTVTLPITRPVSAMDETPQSSPA